jgi:hypothetical protein
MCEGNSGVHNASGCSIRRRTGTFRNLINHTGGLNTRALACVHVCVRVGVQEGACMGEIEVGFAW